MVERALKDCLAVRQFGQREMAEVLKFFQAPGSEPECAFCGSLDVQRWDHLVAINQSGETRPGNMVLSCTRCDDSKRDRPYEEWMISDAAGSPKSRGIGDVAERIERIKTYIQHFRYEVRPLEERLSADERETLAKIRSDLQNLRDRADALIGDYRLRTGAT
jgi:hypothetical protein